MVNCEYGHFVTLNGGGNSNLSSLSVVEESAPVGTGGRDYTWGQGQIGDFRRAEKKSSDIGCYQDFFSESGE